MRWAAADLVDATPFRELIEQRVAQGDSWGDIAQRMGVSSDRLTRAVGRRSYRANGRPYVQARISRDVAARIVRACHAWPMDFDL